MKTTALLAGIVVSSLLAWNRPASAELVTAPDVVIGGFEHSTSAFGNNHFAADVADFTVGSNTLDPDDTFAVRLAAPAGKRFSFDPVVAPQNSNDLLIDLFVSTPNPGVGTWDPSKLSFAFQGVEGSLTGSAEVFAFDLAEGWSFQVIVSNITEAFTFEGIELTFDAPYDAVGPLVVENGMLRGEKYNSVGPGGDVILAQGEPVLSIVPEPGTVSVVLISAAGLMLRRRRS